MPAITSNFQKISTYFEKGAKIMNLVPHITPSTPFWTKFHQKPKSVVTLHTPVMYSGHFGDQNTGLGTLTLQSVISECMFMLMQNISKWLRIQKCSQKRKIMTQRG